MEYFTFDELRAMGCPDELLIQYVLMPKEWILRQQTIKQTNEDKDNE